MNGHDSVPPRSAPRAGARVHVQKFGTLLSNMVMPNIGAFIAWGLITALFIKTGWTDEHFPTGCEIARRLGRQDSAAGGYESGGIVGPMIIYLLPILIAYTGGRMVYDGNPRRLSSAPSPPWAPIAGAERARCSWAP